MASAQSDAPYPYFRRSGDELVQVHGDAQMHGGEELSSTPKVGMRLEADRSEASPGDEVRYWLTVKNLYREPLKSWEAAFFFPRSQVIITDAGGATGGGDHLLFRVPQLRAGEERVYTVRVRLVKNLRPGDTVRTYGSLVWDGTIDRACSKHELVIIGRPPVTGAGDNTAPVENLRAFLRPVSAAQTGSPMPLMVWLGVAVAGVTLGGRLGKRLA